MYVLIQCNIILETNIADYLFLENLFDIGNKYTYLSSIILNAIMFLYYFIAPRDSRIEDRSDEQNNKKGKNKFIVLSLVQKRIKYGNVELFVKLAAKWFLYFYK